MYFQTNNGRKMSSNYVLAEDFRPSSRNRTGNMLTDNYYPVYQQMMPGN